MTLSDKLKTATSSLHVELENLMFTEKIMNLSLSREEYIQMLQVHYAIIAPFEKSWQEFSQVRAQFGEGGNKTNALENDLSALNTIKPSANPQTFHGWDFHKILGAAYVIEGSALGGNIIRKQIEKISSIPSEAVSYFNLCGVDTVKKWRFFIEFLNNHDTNHEKIINGAESTFTLFIKSAREMKNR